MLRPLRFFVRPASWRAASHVHSPSSVKSTQKSSFDFLPVCRRPAKPRSVGVTEVRGPYYSPMGTNYLRDLFGTMGQHIDALKFAGGSFTLMPTEELRAIIDLAHEHDVLVSTGGFIERVLSYGDRYVEPYMKACKDVGFDILEISSGFITMPTDDWLRLVETAQRHGLKAKPEVGVQFGAGGASSAESLESETTKDVRIAIKQAKRFLDAGAYMIMIESEGITECVKSWRTDIISSIVAEVGLEKVMFEAADPKVFSFYIKQFGPDVNLFVDHSQIVELEALRSGVWGTKDTWGRVVSYKPPPLARTGARGRHQHASEDECASRAAASAGEGLKDHGAGTESSGRARA